MAAAAAAARGGKPVELAMTRQLVRVHRDGDVALAFYTTHRTLRAGKPVDETFETLHVWIRKDGAWKLFGAMVRPAANRG
jgi:ketosteroid isomerase-like protein